MVDYSQKRVLLIESVGNMRATIVFMLRQLGIQDILPISTHLEVFETLQEKQFDLVLLGHNARDAYTGLQMLEEARHRKLIHPSACWVFMTSDSSQETVLHALDSQPDLLIGKPFSASELKHRLDIVLERKSALGSVHEAILIGNLNQAVRLCDQVEVVGSNYDYVQLLKGRLLLQMNRFEEAEHFFKHRFTRLNEKESGPCLAQAYIGQDRLTDAKKVLTESIAKYPLYMQSYDLLTDVLERSGDLHNAQEAILAATEQSPQSFLRQMRLGKLAVFNKNLDQADMAYRRSIALNKTSCHRSAEPFLRLANVKRMEMKGLNDRQQIKLFNDVESLLNTGGFQFPNDDRFKMHSMLLRSQVCLDMGDKEHAKQLAQQAQILVKDLGGDIDIKRSLIDVLGDPTPVLEKAKEESVPAARKATKHKHDPEMSQKVNRLGVSHYNAAKTAQAIRYFGLAIEHDAKNAKALLNLAQLFLESAIQQNDRREERLKMVQRYLRLTQRMALQGEELAKRKVLEQHLETDLHHLPKGSLGALLK
jgi:tetratricopeptide (TPR) repeat protein